MVMDELERRFARFGAMVAREGWLDRHPGSGFTLIRDSRMDEIADECGLMYPLDFEPESIALNPFEGVVKAAARLSRPAPSDDELWARTRNTVAELALALGLKVDAGEGE